MTFPIPFSGCGINKVFVSMSGCSGGCAGACGHRTGISHDSSQQWEGFGSHCQQLQSPQATGRVVESQPGRMNRRGERGRAEDGVAHGSLSTAMESCGAQILWRILWGIPVGLPHIPITHSQQVALLSSRLPRPQPAEEHNRRLCQLSLLSDSLPGWSCHPAPTASQGYQLPPGH